jgi:hypothetical protein
VQCLQSAGTLFAHYDPTAYGVGWKFGKNRSDVKNVTGSYPAFTVGILPRWSITVSWTSAAAQIADEHHKLTCLAETGYEQIPMADWWTKVLQPELQKNYRTSYVLAWRNGRPDHYYVPYPGQVSEQDFVKFFNAKSNIFQNRLTPLAVYGKYIVPVPNK